VKLTSSQIAEWEAYDKLDPIGDFRSDFNAAQIMSLVYNLVVQMYGKKGQTKLSVPLDFMIMWGQEEKDEKAQSIEQMKEVMMAIAQKQNENVDREMSKRDNRSLYRKRKDLR